MTSPSYPAALDALANPGPTTETDDAGFELDVVVARLQNCVIAIEQKLGIGPSAPGASAAVLRRTATGTSTWGQVAAGDVALGAIATADIGANQVSQAGVSVGVTSPVCNSATYIDLVTTGATPQQVTLANVLAGSDIEAWFAGGFSLPSANNVSVAFSLDGAAESFVMTLTETLATAFFSVVLVGFWPAVSAGTHTVKMRWQSSPASTTANGAQRVLLVRERRR